jgi:hypothetical protein
MISPIGLSGEICRRRVVRERRELGETVENFLFRLLISVVVGELHLHVRQAKQRYRADRRDVRNSRKLDLDRDRDVTFDLLGRLTGILRDNVDERWHRVGIGLDIELSECDDAEYQHGEEHHEDEHPLAQRKCDHRIHLCGPLVAVGCQLRIGTRRQRRVIKIRFRLPRDR